MDPADRPHPAATSQQAAKSRNPSPKEEGLPCGTPPKLHKLHASGAWKLLNVAHPRPTKAALAARPDRLGEGERGTHRGGAGSGMAASVTGRGNVGNWFWQLTTIRQSAVDCGFGPIAKLSRCAQVEALSCRFVWPARVRVAAKEIERVLRSRARSARNTF